MTKENPTLDELLPHRPPMVLLSRVVSIDLECLEAEVEIVESSPFFMKGRGVPSWVGIEYMAQTAALYGGALAQKDQEPPGIAFLLGARRYMVSEQFFKEGWILKVKAQPILIESPLSSFQCAIFHGDERLAEGRINAYKPTEDMLEELRNDEP